MSSNDKPPIPLKIGTKVACYWPDDDYWYKGAVAKQLGDYRYWIRYDDGGEGEVNVREDKWRFSMDPNPAEKEKRATIAALEPGSRIKVYFPHEQEYYAGTLTKKQDNDSKKDPHHIEYDDGDMEWTNLLFRKFEEIPKKASRAQAGSHITVDHDESRTRNGVPASVVKIGPDNVRSHEVKQEDQDGTMVKIEPDNVRSLEVKHEQETKKECSNLHTDSTADVKVERGEKRRKEEFEDTDHPQKKQKRPQENLEVSEKNPEGSSASKAQSKQGTSKAGKSVKKTIAVEQIDLQTGAIVASFPSMNKAARETGIAYIAIWRVLEKRGKANGGGYFWRWQGETHGPWPDPVHSKSKPVEQLDWETGEVLETYESLSEAKRKMCMDPTRKCIRLICDGIGGRQTADGYFWRWKGSDSLPSHLMGESEARGPGTWRVLEIRKERNGKVEKVFKSTKEARAFFGNTCSQQTIRNHCKANDFFLGYYWRYRLVARRRPPKTMIGRRLKIKQANNEWQEGKIKSFCSNTGMHEILFDCGRTEQRCLEDVEYEWKNDQGQKSVEQLDLQTGQVLASFDSISDANRILGLSSSLISHVCHGRQRSAFGYFWRFKGSKELPREKKCFVLPTKVDQLCLKTGQVIATFDKIIDATNVLGISRQSIGKCCNGRRGYKSAGGFGWRFSKEDDGDCDVE